MVTTIQNVNGESFKQAIDLAINTKPKNKAKAHHHFCKLMGCQFILTAVHQSPQIAWDGIRAGVAEIERIEELISSWKPTSQTSEINRKAGIEPIKVSPELFNLIDRSLLVSKLTAGAFDISGTLSRYYWQFDKAEHDMLPLAKIRELRELINYQNVELDKTNSTVFLKKAGMKIGFGGIGKGYAAVRAQEIMRRHGIMAGIVNASGDIMCWGSPPNKHFWDVKIPDPEQMEASLFEVTIPYGSLVTSGDYESYTMINGQRFSHIIDPRTGLPVKSLKSVSVICPNPELGDALATAISVLGATAGIKLINKLNGIECLIVDQNNVKYYSDHMLKLVK